MSPGHGTYNAVMSAVRHVSGSQQARPQWSLRELCVGLTVVSANLAFSRIGWGHLALVLTLLLIFRIRLARERTRFLLAVICLVAHNIMFQIFPIYRL